MKKLLILLILLFLLGGCNKVKSEIAKPTYPSKTSFETTKGSQYQGLKLDFDFYMALNTFSYQSSSLILDESQNQMYSPISLYMALSMLAEGCTDGTLDEILKVLNVKDLKVLRTENQKLFQKLYFENEVGKLMFANSIWLNKDHEYVESTLKLLAKYYYAYSYSLDFTDQANGKQIGSWIKKHTGGKLGDENFPLNPNTLVILINTIYFYDEWKTQFSTTSTVNKPFYGDKVENVPFMIEMINTLYLKKDNHAIAALSFKNNSNMIFVLPDKNTSINDILENPDIYNDIFDLKDAESKEVHFEIPKFSYKSKYDLIPTLNEMGIKKAFGNADLQNLLKESGYVSQVIQESSIVVDEKGCEATAYTQISVDTSLPAKEVEFKLNRPFLYAITSPEGLLLFIGVVNNPKES